MFGRARDEGTPSVPLNVKPGRNTTSHSQVESLDDAVALAYRELRAIAHRRLRARDERGTLTTTALVHEAYLKLADNSARDWQDRAHFLALASVVMRHVLVDRARQVSALKRGGINQRVTFDDNQLCVENESIALLQLDDALEELAQFEPRLARVVECRFFGGLTEQETADALEITVRTVQRDWVKARILLQRALSA
jgi:RNA polymerase sigma factor (TIGR02999 family)